MSSLNQLHLQNLGKSIDRLESDIQQCKNPHEKSASIQTEFDDIQQIIDMIRLNNKNILITPEDKLQFKDYTKRFRKVKHIWNTQHIPIPSEIIIEMGPIETPDSLIAHGQSIMQQDLKSTKNMISVIQNTKDIGISTAQKLASQTEQIDKMQDNLHAIDSELNRAKVVIRRIARGLAQSKTLWCMIGLIVVLIVVVIVLKLK